MVSSRYRYSDDPYSYKGQFTMVKRISECYDQWENIPTYSLADEINADCYKPLLNNCSSYDDFQDKVRADVTDKVNNCKQTACDIEMSPMMNMILLSAIDSISIDNIVQAVMNCYAPDLRIFKLEQRLDRLYNLLLEKKSVTERSTTSPHEGDILAFNIATKFNKDDVEVDSTVDAKNKKDAWTLRLVYNDSSQDEMSLVKVDDDKDDYVLKSNKDKLKVKFTDDDSDNKLAVPQEVIDHIQKHIDSAEAKNKESRNSQDQDVAKMIGYEIKNNFQNYDLEVIDGDNSNGKWNIELVYPNGTKDTFTIRKLGKSYLLTSKDMMVAKFGLDELKQFPKKLKDHIQKHLKK